MMTRNKKKAGRGLTRDAWVECHNRIVRRSEVPTIQEWEEQNHKNKYKKDELSKKSDHDSLFSGDNSPEDLTETMDTEEDFKTNERKMSQNVFKSINNENGENRNNQKLTADLQPGSKNNVRSSTNHTKTNGNELKKNSKILRQQFNDKESQQTDNNNSKATKKSSLFLNDTDSNKELTFQDRSNATFERGNQSDIDLTSYQTERETNKTEDRKKDIRETIHSVTIKKEKTDEAGTSLLKEIDWESYSTDDNDNSLLGESTEHSSSDGSVLLDHNIQQTVIATQSSSVKRKLTHLHAEKLAKKQYGTPEDAGSFDTTKDLENTSVGEEEVSDIEVMELEHSENTSHPQEEESLDDEQRYIEEVQKVTAEDNTPIDEQASISDKGKNGNYIGSNSPKKSIRAQLEI